MLPIAAKRGRSSLELSIFSAVAELSPLANCCIQMMRNKVLHIS